MRTLFLMLLTLTVPSLAHAATYTIGPGESVTSAMGRLNPGDTLYLKTGTYTEPFHGYLGTHWPSGSSWQAPITIASAPGETAVLRTSTGNTFDIGTSSGMVQYLIFDRLVFDGTNSIADGVHRDFLKLDGGSQFIRIQNSQIVGNPKSIGVGVQWGDSTNNELLNNEISNFSIYGIYMGGSSNLIDGNNIHDNGGYGIHLYGWGRTDYDNNVIRNNRIVNNGGMAVSTTTTCGILLSSGSNNQAINNVVMDQQDGHNIGGGCGVQVYGTARGAQVIGNTITGNHAACIDVNPGSRGAVIRDNVCQSNGGDIIDNGGESQIAHNWF